MACGVPLGRMCVQLVLLVSVLSVASGHKDEDSDPFRWLEVVNNSRVINWVQNQNNLTLSKVGDPAASPLFPRILDLLQSSPKLPSVSTRGDFLYNFWTDEVHLRGLWRRTTLEEFRRDNPKWEPVLDLDELAEAEGEHWVWKGCETLHAAEDLCLMSLSRGGADAVVVREFNLTSKAFVQPPFGFVVPEAKTQITYRDRNSVFVGTDCGAGSFTTSGYARKVHIWNRGEELCSSTVAFEGDDRDVSAGAWRVHGSRGPTLDWYARSTSFFDSEHWVQIVAGTGSPSGLVRLPVPSTSEVTTFVDQLVVSLKSNFTVLKRTFEPGSVLVAPISQVLAGEPEWMPLFLPTANASCTSITKTRSYLVLRVLDAVRVLLISWKYTTNSSWISSQSPHFTASVNVRAFHEETSDALWISSESFLEPPSLALAKSAGKPAEAEVLKTTPAVFDASGLQVSQRWAVSRDGTRVPYFLIHKAGAPSNQSTILYGYGGFEISLLPRYSMVLGWAWLQRGGAYALANIRGGGEFGPVWHQSAMRDGKHRSYEDFAAVAQQLVDTGVTSPGKLAAMGGSNGGLLVGNMLVKYPALFGAVVCNVPLLDMWRYNKLLAGASWVAEYGNPDVPSEWEYLRQNSPYHLVDPAVTYPPVLFKTSTRDDRVHPSHARKMAARLQQEVPSSAKHVLFFEATEGGHGGALARQTASESVLTYTFLGQTLGLNLAADLGSGKRRLRASKEVWV